MRRPFSSDSTIASDSRAHQPPHLPMPLTDSSPTNAGALLCIVGARPNYMKMAPLLRAMERQAGLPPVVLVHTGQHYDFALNDRLFSDLQLRAPDVNLEVGSGTHATQTAEVMKRFEPLIERYRPACVIVV